jgi:hypothetical protein
VERSPLLVATLFTRLHPAGLCLGSLHHRLVIWLLLAAAVLISAVVVRAVLELERYP